MTEVIKIKKALIIVNPVSGLGDSKKRKQLIKSVAKKHGWIGEYAETSLKISAKLIAQQAIKKGVKHIVVCGGDGTVMEALVAAVKKPVTIGVVPLGTGNLFARNLNIPLDTEEAIKTAFSGKAEKIDIGVANGNFFSIVAGMGVDVDMIKDATRELKNRLGFFAYIVAAIKNIKNPPGHYSIVIDRNKAMHVKAKSILVANMGKIPGGIKFVPSAHPKSGTLSIGIIQENKMFSLLDITINALRGNVNKSSDYKLYKGKKIEITSLKKKRPYQCDGDAFPKTNKLKVIIYPSAVSVIFPK